MPNVFKVLFFGAILFSFYTAKADSHSKYITARAYMARIAGVPESVLDNDQVRISRDIQLEADCTLHIEFEKFLYTAGDEIRFIDYFSFQLVPSFQGKTQFSPTAVVSSNEQIYLKYGSDISLIGFSVNTMEPYNCEQAGCTSEMPLSHYISPSQVHVEGVYYTGNHYELRTADCALTPEL